MRVEAYSAVNRIYQSGAASSTKKGGSTASYSDKLEISRTAKDYQTAKEAVSRTSEVREDKVAQIKAAMEAGTYRVSAQEVAGKMHLLMYLDRKMQSIKNCWSYPITRQRQLSVRILSGYRIFWFRNRLRLMPLTNWNSSVWKM